MYVHDDYFCFGIGKLMLPCNSKMKQRGSSIVVVVVDFNFFFRRLGFCGFVVIYRL